MRGSEQLLPVDPYVLGIWLGDGTSRSASVTTADAVIVDALRAAGHRTTYETEAGAARTYGLTSLYRPLRLLGVIGNKHIPWRYLTAGVDERLALLQGLADTDGTVAKNGSQQSITTTSEVLARDIRLLINTLGGVWTEYARRPRRRSRIPSTSAFLTGCLASDWSESSLGCQGQL